MVPLGLLIQKLPLGLLIPPTSKTKRDMFPDRRVGRPVRPHGHAGEHAPLLPLRRARRRAETKGHGAHLKSGKTRLETGCSKTSTLGLRGEDRSDDSDVHLAGTGPIAGGGGGLRPVPAARLLLAGACPQPGGDARSSANPAKKFRPRAEGQRNSPRLEAGL